MYQTIAPDTLSEVPWPTHRTSAADAPATPAAEKVSPGSVDPLHRVIQGAHDAVDRFAEGAAPKRRQLGERVARAEAALGEGAVRLGRARDVWAEGARRRVRGNPLTAMVAALALGAVIARLTR